MPSDVDICNLALSHLGDDATVASIDPPEGSSQSEHCARFYPIARDALLSMHYWNFASKRQALALVTNPWTTWQYAYALPSDCIEAVSVLSNEAGNDYAIPSRSTTFCDFTPSYGMQMPQEFSIETNQLGQSVIYTNQANAVLRYQARVVDPTRFSPLFTTALGWHLASMLAGPLIKGEAGSAQAKRCEQMMIGFLNEARTRDSNQREVKPVHIAPWMAGR